VKPNLKSGCLCICLLAAAGPGFSQDPASQTPPPATNPAPSTNPASAPPPPREIPSDVNSGRGLSVEPLYWKTTFKGGIRRGSINTSSNSGVLDYPNSPQYMYGAVVTVPSGKTNAVRVTYLATRNYTAGATVAPAALNIFGTDIAGGDPIAVSYKLTNFKLSYDFLTYFFKRGSTDFRVKTLWEVQYFSTNNSLLDFIPQPDGTFAPNSIGKDKNIIYPTFGLALEHTISRHFRWEAKGSGFALPHRSTLGDAEASVALRYGRIEFVGGAKLIHFKTKSHDDNYVSGNLYGPYAGLRLYWKKQ
jgi:hypothetical protein